MMPGQGPRSVRERSWPVPHAARQRGFSLIEILVVAAVIVLILALALPVFGQVFHQQKVTEATITMRQLANAIDQYATIYGRLGANLDSSDFTAAPYAFLVLRREADGLVPLVQLRPQDRGGVGQSEPLTVPDHRASQTVDVSTAPTPAHHAGLIRDPFGNAYRVTVVNANATGSSDIVYPAFIAVTCTAGTALPGDDRTLFTNRIPGLELSGRTWPVTDGAWELAE